ncbi:MAG: proprotein convertase P-domain-containing protein [Leptolyngbya sp. Prado105]|nr:proprotein convertase P-domain-containing protein [Leptolyngbya sp. Prado105]
MIPDNSSAGIASEIQINEVAPIKDIQVTVNITHDFLGDIEVSLVSPSGRATLLQGRTLGRQTALNRTYSLQTTPTLRRMLGQSAQGRWQLRVVDAIANDTGMINSWRLAIGI